MRILALALTAAIALTAAQAVTAQTRVKPTPVTPVPQGLTLQTKKPDFVITNADAVAGSSDKLQIIVKNLGSVTSPAAHARVSNMAPGNTGAALVSIPPIKPGWTKGITVTLSKPARPGNRILVEADYNKAVAETNENNNNYGFNWQ